MINLTQRSFALTLLMLETLGGFGTEGGMYKDLKRQEFLALLYLSLRVHRTSGTLLRRFINSDEIKKLVIWGYLVVSKAGLYVHYELSDKGRQKVEGMVDWIITNIKEFDKHLNLINNEREEK